MKSSPLPLRALLALVCASTSLQAQTSVMSVPQGYVNVDIKASTDGTTYAVTQFSAPLEPAATITGQKTALISSVAASTISNSSAGWTAGALSTASAPYFVKIRTGSAAGRMFLITANTATALTVATQGVDLTTLGIATGASGDGYDIIPAHTLLSLAGTPADGVVGGTAAQFAAGQVDKVLLNDVTGTPRYYYYDTDFSQWRTDNSSTSQDATVISPLAGLAYYRLSTTPLSLTFLGTVPSTNAQEPVPLSGTTLLASYFPATTTLSALAFNTLPGWRKLGDSGVTVKNADRVLIEEAPGLLTSFYYDGTSWKRAGSAADQGPIKVQPASTIYCVRFGPAGSAENWVHSMPYTLN